jgi:hypothetical protein
MKIKTTEVKEVDVDLRLMAYIHWPQEAKDLALVILMNPRLRKQMDSQLEGLRRDWLINKIEELATLDILNEL